MGNKDFAYKKKTHISQPKNDLKVDNNLKKYMYDLHRKQDLIGAIIFAVILIILLSFAPRAISSETKIKDEITAWYEDTSTSIKNELLGIGNFVINVPENVGNGLLNYWEEVKIYQTESWAKTREENPGIYSLYDKLKQYLMPTEIDKK